MLIGGVKVFVGMVFGMVIFVLIVVVVVFGVNMGNGMFGMIML